MTISKRCSKCNEEKNVSEFSKAQGNADGYNSLCMPCVAERVRAYYKTSKGVIGHIYNTQKTSSKARGHVPPAYTKEELNVWLLSQGFDVFFDVWVASGYEKDLRPSADRLDSNLPYTFDNLRLVTWAENNQAVAVERKSCKLVTKQCRGIKQIFDGMTINTFKSVAMAARETGIQRTNINATCKGRVPRAGGYCWEYV